MENIQIKDFSEIENKLTGKKILYIASKRASYLRVSQQMRLIAEKSSNYKFIVSDYRNYYLQLISIILRTCFVNVKKYDLVFVGAFPQFIVPFFERKFKRCDLWVDLHISFYDTLVFDRKKFRKDSLCGKLLWHLDKKTLDLSHYVVADTKMHGLYFVQEFVQDLSKIFVMYLEADKKIYYPMNIAKPSKWKDKYVVFYFGSMNPLQGINVVLEAIERLKVEKGIYFIIVGPIDKKIEKYTGETVKYIDWLTQEEIAKYIAISDLCLSGHFSANIEKANRTIPGKAYIYDAMEKRIILGDSEANREYFQENEKYKFVELGNSQALSELIMKMYYEWIKAN